jgi:hypothetical protein
MRAARHEQPRPTPPRHQPWRRSLTTLAEIYNWFTEGFYTADLKDARTLLDELSD